MFCFAYKIFTFALIELHKYCCICNDSMGVSIVVFPYMGVSVAYFWQFCGRQNTSFRPKVDKQE